MSGQNATIFRKSYQPPSFLVPSISLRFTLDPARTLVQATLDVRRNPAAQSGPAYLELNGEALELAGVVLDGRQLDSDDYSYDGTRLRIECVPDAFTLEIETVIHPQDNTALEGLYLSSGNFCTQCEAEGFRRITCFPDRPDVLSVYTTTIIADQAKYPVLLANGNLVDQGGMADGRHFATWHDPFPKPCYLFALVAGDLVRIEDSFTTRSGRKIALHIYVEPRNREKCSHAMTSLQKAMRWDEEVFGLEYDLDTYMIVAVDDFNMGAMENKGLNVFNSKFVLARPETATDADYEGIEGVIAHEYFHNWTGNRVTCRDWFQLSLKEGLTVFRDQEFSADMQSRPVQRIKDVQLIRNFQFREDAGPMAHPVRPDSFQEINNFYTLTVYDKGAEVIRMSHTLLGAQGFRQGMDLYFARHDGQAVTCDDFVAAMADATGYDLTQFKRWYSQAGTPELTVATAYDQAAKRYAITVRQHTPGTPGQENKEPFFMPLACGLMDRKGSDLGMERVFVLDREVQTFFYENLDTEPVLSFLRNFSAPVRVVREESDDELALRMAHDRDRFNRWDAGQQLALRHLLQAVASWQNREAVILNPLFQEAFATQLEDTREEPDFLAQALTLPHENWIGQQLALIDPEAVFQARQQYLYLLGQNLRQTFFAAYERLRTPGPCHFTAEEAGRRSLRACCLGYLLAGDGHHPVESGLLDLARGQYREADNMTDSLAALSTVVNADREAGDELLADFFSRWRDEPLVVDKWLSLQAACRLPGTLQRVRELCRHPAFNPANPNKVRALVATFCANHHQFHGTAGEGYQFLEEWVLRLDSSNPQIAARLLTPLCTWRRYDTKRQHLMCGALERIKTQAGSKDVLEIAEKSLPR